MKYLVTSNPSRKLNKTDEIYSGDYHVTKKVNLTIHIAEINHSNDFVTLRVAIVRQLFFFKRSSIRGVWYNGICE